MVHSKPSGAEDQESGSDMGELRRMLVHDSERLSGIELQLQNGDGGTKSFSNPFWDTRSNRRRFEFSDEGMHPDDLIDWMEAWGLTKRVSNEANNFIDNSALDEEACEYEEEEVLADTHIVEVVESTTRENDLRRAFEETERKVSSILTDDDDELLIMTGDGISNTLVQSSIRLWPFKVMCVIKKNHSREFTEPTVATIDHGLDNKTNWHNKEIMLTFDPGGNTMNVSLLSTGDVTLEVKFTAGDIHLGRERLNNRMIDSCVEHEERLKQQHSVVKRRVENRGDSDSRPARARRKEGRFGRPCVRIREAVPDQLRPKLPPTQGSCDSMFDRVNRFFKRTHCISCMRTRNPSYEFSLQYHDITIRNRMSTCTKFNMISAKECDSLLSFNAGISRHIHEYIARAEKSGRNHSLRESVVEYVEAWFSSRGRRSVYHSAVLFQEQRRQACASYDTFFWMTETETEQVAKRDLEEKETMAGHGDLVLDSEELVLRPGVDSNSKERTGKAALLAKVKIEVQDNAVKRSERIVLPGSVIYKGIHLGILSVASVSSMFQASGVYSGSQRIPPERETTGVSMLARYCLDWSQVWNFIPSSGTRGSPSLWSDGEHLKHEGQLSLVCDKVFEKCLAPSTGEEGCDDTILTLVQFKNPIIFTASTGNEILSYVSDCEEIMQVTSMESITHTTALFETASFSCGSAESTSSVLIVSLGVQNIACGHFHSFKSVDQVVRMMQSMLNDGDCYSTNLGSSRTRPARARLKVIIAATCRPHQLEAIPEVVRSNSWSSSLSPPVTDAGQVALKKQQATQLGALRQKQRDTAQRNLSVRMTEACVSKSVLQL